MIEIENLYKIYNLSDEIDVKALNGVSLDITQGEFVSIMGSSGSGKSTFMNILGFLDVPTSGRYILDGVDARSINDNEMAEIRNKKIGFVFQGFNLLSRTTALENVELPLFYRDNIPRGVIKRKAKEMLSLVGLSGREFHHPNKLSGGQQQRVAIARALINDPAIILADEPTGNLDTANTKEVMNIFTRLNEDIGITIVLVTHEPDVAEYTGRKVVFSDGKIIRDDKVGKKLGKSRK
ncbi:MAG: ABC transporter ATP-binding protein [Spirochaetes bacterium]|nr:ABC transporter ATP-binding protein [Spirochaetota bacterium]